MNEKSPFAATGSQPQDARQPRPPVRERFQFGLRGLIILLTVGAVLAGWVSMMPLPDIAKFVFLGYFLFMAAYIVLRLPFLMRGMLRKTPAWDQLRRDREELARMVSEKRKESEEKREGPSE